MTPDEPIVLQGAEASPMPEPFAVSLTAFELGTIIGMVQRWIDDNGENTGIKNLKRKLNRALRNGK